MHAYVRVQQHRPLWYVAQTYWCTHRNVQIFLATLIATMMVTENADEKTLSHKFYPIIIIICCILHSFMPRPLSIFFGVGLWTKHKFFFWFFSNPIRINILNANICSMCFYFSPFFGHHFCRVFLHCAHNSRYLFSINFICYFHHFFS